MIPLSAQPVFHLLGYLLAGVPALSIVAVFTVSLRSHFANRARLVRVPCPSRARIAARPASRL